MGVISREQVADEFGDFARWLSERSSSYAEYEYWMEVIDGLLEMMEI